MCDRRINLLELKHFKHFLLELALHVHHCRRNDCRKKYFHMLKRSSFALVQADWFLTGHSQRQTTKQDTCPCALWMRCRANNTWPGVQWQTFRTLCQITCSVLETSSSKAGHFSFISRSSPSITIKVNPPKVLPQYFMNICNSSTSSYPTKVT